jgi:hypothetical protein
VLPKPTPTFSSHKFAKKGGVRYEVALCIQTGDIVWVNGPFPCGRNPDITIFHLSLLHHLGENERVEADDGYIGLAPRYVKCPKIFANLEETGFMPQCVRNRQETVNKQFKHWDCLKQIFTRRQSTSNSTIGNASSKYLSTMEMFSVQLR